MPQMAPMNWLMLMIYFSMIFILMNNLNYFSFNYEIMKNKNLMFKMKKNNWKW